MKKMIELVYIQFYVVLNNCYKLDVCLIFSKKICSVLFTKWDIIYILCLIDGFCFLSIWFCITFIIWVSKRIQYTLDILLRLIQNSLILKGLFSWECTFLCWLPLYIIAFFSAAYLLLFHFNLQDHFMKY